MFFYPKEIHENYQVIFWTHISNHDGKVCMVKQYIAQNLKTRIYSFDIIYENWTTNISIRRERLRQAIKILRSTICLHYKF